MGCTATRASEQFLQMEETKMKTKELIKTAEKLGWTAKDDCITFKSVCIRIAEDVASTMQRIYDVAEDCSYTEEGERACELYFTVIN